MYGGWKNNKKFVYLQLHPQEPSYRTGLTF